MPVFEFKCNACGKDFESLVRADERISCPFCQSEMLIKKISLFAAPAKTESTSNCADRCDDFQRGECGNGGCCCSNSF